MCDCVCTVLRGCFFGTEYVYLFISACLCVCLCVCCDMCVAMAMCVCACPPSAAGGSVEGRGEGLPPGPLLALVDQMETEANNALALTLREAAKR